MNRQEILACLAQAEMIETLSKREGKEIPSLVEAAQALQKILLDALNVTYA